jgi:hypothetical protein
VTAVSKHSQGKPDPDWKSHVIATVPSEKVVPDDPGHSYHLLDSGGGVATSEPARLDPATAQAARGASGVTSTGPNQGQKPAAVPPGMMDPSAIAAAQGTVVIGQPIEQPDRGHAILGALSQGDPNGLQPIGVGTLPILANSIEWGLGEWQQPSAKSGSPSPSPASNVYRIVKGGAGAVDWAQVPDLKGIGHSHPARQIDPNAKDLMTKKSGSGSMKLEDLFKVDQCRARVLPSTSDFHYTYSQGVEQHIVHTPYQIDAQTKEVFNPTEMRTVMVQQGQPLNFVINRKLMALEKDGFFYRGTLVATGGGSEVWRGGFLCMANFSAMPPDITGPPLSVPAPPPAAAQGGGSTSAGQIPPPDEKKKGC